MAEPTRDHNYRSLGRTPLSSEIGTIWHEKCFTLYVLASPDAGYNAPFWTGYPGFLGVANSHSDMIFQQTSPGTFTNCKRI